MERMLVKQKLEVAAVTVFTSPQRHIVAPPIEYITEQNAQQTITMTFINLYITQLLSL